MNIKIVGVQNPTIQGEIAFAVRSFNKLPSRERALIIETLRNSDVGVRTTVLPKFEPLLTGDEDGRELTKFINEFIGEPGLFDEYVIASMHEKTILVGMHFKYNLPTRNTDLLEEFTKPVGRVAKTTA
jgi:hypothetical protein